MSCQLDDLGSLLEKLSNPLRKGEHPRTINEEWWGFLGRGWRSNQLLHLFLPLTQPLLLFLDQEVEVHPYSCFPNASSFCWSTRSICSSFTRTFWAVTRVLFVFSRDRV